MSDEEKKPGRVYREGEKVWVRGIVAEVDADSPGEMYLVQTGTHDPERDGYTDESWYAQEDVTTFESGEEGIEPGDFVKLRRNSEAGHVQLGQVIALRKGRAWVDWEPFNDAVDASGAAAVSVLARASAEEVRALKERLGVA